MANHLIHRHPQHPLGRFGPFSDMEEVMHDFFAPALRLREGASSRMRVDISETE